MNEKKPYIAPEYFVVEFDDDSILTAKSNGCQEIWGSESGTTCGENYFSNN